MQDPKYQFLHELVMNRHTGEIIPADEPVFVFRARDVRALKALHAYEQAIPDENREHKVAVRGRILDFARFKNDHPERMKEPDTPA